MKTSSAKWTKLACVVLLSALGAACNGKARYDQAVCVLIDVSGTYADQREEVVRTIKREVLPGMLPGDTLLVIRIDGESYDRENLETLVTLDPRPSRANAQKLAVAQTLDAFATQTVSAQHTDIPGAMMLGSEYLRELASGSRVMLVFSDMEEDLAPGTRRDLRPDEFNDIEVVAMNVKRLSGDTVDPAKFRHRLAEWEKRVLSSGGRGWRTFMDAGRLGDYLREVRES